MLAGEPDERLVALARAGDERAFAAIVERYRAPLLRHVLGYLPPAAAEDALQQAFINAYAALTRDSAKAPVSLRPWLYRVAHNAALNVRRDPQAAFAPLPEGLDGVERPDEALQRSERLRAVVGAVRALPDRQRQVIVRHALDGDSHEQIAADLGVSAGAIRQLAHRARQTVREAAAALSPLPLLRWLPLAESTAGGGTGAGKFAAALVVTAVAGGGAVEVARHERAPAVREVAARVAKPIERKARAAAPVAAARIVPAPVRPAPRPVVAGDREAPRDAAPREDSSGHGSSGSGSGSSGSGSSGSGSGSSGGDGGTSGSGTSGGGTSGSGSSGSSGSGSGTSPSSGSGSYTSGSGSSGSSGSGSGSSGSSGSGSSGIGSATVTPTPEPISSGSGSSGSSGSGSSGSSGSGSSGSGTSGSG